LCKLITLLADSDMSYSQHMFCTEEEKILRKTGNLGSSSNEGINLS